MHFLITIWLTTNGRVDDERRHASLLTNRGFLALRHVDVGGDDAQRLRGRVFGVLDADGRAEGLADVRREVGQSLRDQLKETIFKVEYGRI
jgi:hypothetical protein